MSDADTKMEEGEGTRHKDINMEDKEEEIKEKSEEKCEEVNKKENTEEDNNNEWEEVTSDNKKQSNKKMEVPPSTKKIMSTKVCSGQPSLSTTQLQEAFPALNQNFFCIKFEMNAGRGKNFENERYIWAIKTFFQLCIRKDNTFKILPINAKESGANTISHVDQIPIEQDMFDNSYTYDTYIRPNRIALKMIVATKFRFSEMFKDT